MSDEEAEYSEEEYEEEEVEEVEETQHEYKYNYDQEEEEHKGRADRAKSKIDIELEDKNLSEGEKAMLLAKKRQEEEDKLKLLDYEDRRRMEREQEDDELRKLKEKQEQRRLQREQEEREMAEKKRQEEEKRRQEEEERRARMEAERKKKEEEKLKKSQVANLFGGIQPGAQGGRNFVIPEKKDKSDRFGNIVQAKQEMGMTKEQQEDAKKSFLTQIKKILEVSGLHGSELKQKIKELHQRICKLEAEKYDLEKRHERQTYDLKELNERQRQMFRNKLTGQGVDPADANSRHPPKIRIMSKYDRQTDRRNYSERRAVFETKSAFPLFPNVPPPPTIMEFKIKPEVKKDVLDDYSYGGYGEEEEVYEEEEE